MLFIFRSASWSLPNATIPIEVIFSGIMSLDIKKLDLLKSEIGKL